MHESEYICILRAANEIELSDLWYKSQTMKIPGACFNEPDFDNSLTAIALAPSPESKKLCSNLPLALKEKK